MTAVNFAAGAAVAALLWLGLRATFQHPVFARSNYRGADVPVGAGIVVALSTVAVFAFRIVKPVLLDRGDGWLDFSPLSYGDQSTEGVFRSLRDGPRFGSPLVMVLVLTVAFALFGLFDDLGAGPGDRGFRGHLGALKERRLTTGLVKLVFGGLVALAVAAQVDLAEDWGAVLVDAALIALAANVGNLFDRAPGRTTKVALLCGLPMLVLAHAWQVDAVAIVLGAAAGLLVFDLREELMLGDTGSNVLGAVLGVGVVYALPFGARVVVLLVVLALNLASEKVSFSKVIDRVAPLRFLDRLGRRPLDAAAGEPPTA